MAGFLEGLFGKSGGYQQVQNFTPHQQEVLQQILQQALQGLQPQSFGQNFEPIAANARQQFSQQTVPSIAERFTSMGGQRSSAFGQQLGAAGAGLESNLGAQKAQFGLQQQGLLQQLLGMGLQPQFQTDYMQRQPGFLEGLGGAAASGLGMGLTGGIGGVGAGASGILAALKSLFGR